MYIAVTENEKNRLSLPNFNGGRYGDMAEGEFISILQQTKLNCTNKISIESTFHLLQRKNISIEPINVTSYFRDILEVTENDDLKDNNVTQFKNIDWSLVNYVSSRLISCDLLLSLFRIDLKNITSTADNVPLTIDNYMNKLGNGFSKWLLSVKESKEEDRTTIEKILLERLTNYGYSITLHAYGKESLRNKSKRKIIDLFDKYIIVDLVKKPRIKSNPSGRTNNNGGSSTNNSITSKHLQLNLILVYDTSQRDAFGSIGTLKSCMITTCMNLEPLNSMKKFAIRNRIATGPTSIKAELAQIMVNVAKVNEDTCFVYDPFVGTGSLLLMASKSGAKMPLGSDIKIGNGQDNFSHFNLAKPDFININVFNLPFYDFSNENRMKFDCIITDPPYGIREFRMINKSISDSRSSSLKALHDSISTYVNELMKIGQKMLVGGGRLVFLFPVYNIKVKGNDVAAMLPKVTGMNFVFALPEPFHKWNPPGYRFLVCYERKM